MTLVFFVVGVVVGYLVGPYVNEVVAGVKKKLDDWR